MERRKTSWEAVAVAWVRGDGQRWNAERSLELCLELIGHNQLSVSIENKSQKGPKFSNSICHVDFHSLTKTKQYFSMCVTRTSNLSEHP